MPKITELETKEPATPQIVSDKLLAVIDEKIQDLNYRKRKEYEKARTAKDLGDQLGDMEYELVQMREKMESILS